MFTLKLKPGGNYDCVGWLYKGPFFSPGLIISMLGQPLSKRIMAELSPGLIPSMCHCSSLSQLGLYSPRTGAECEGTFGSPLPGAQHKRWGQASSDQCWGQLPLLRPADR